MVRHEGRLQHVERRSSLTVVDLGKEANAGAIARAEGGADLYVDPFGLDQNGRGSLLVGEVDHLEGEGESRGSTPVSLQVKQQRA
eukprot:758814-Hanusia_phi.AAC.5